ncbi:MAG TPA: SMP-30/gluconolactonase/LRE family protein [Roseiflexaceae bacterium]|nr:SMP-30/gluconolactonase/LRE family protein [Roseiflexaceae bacterium]HMP40824.1 SMP-30/gluconolactonase/LRE family protein [Roseiflexaceae bacterium]
MEQYELPEATPAPWRGVVRYPDPDVIALDARFERYRLGSAVIERIATGMRWAEGPAWFGDGRFLLWSDIPNNRIMRWCEETGRVSVFRAPAHYTNGNTRDRQGRLISCEHGARRVTRTEHDGRISVVCDSYDGKRLNAPNDVVVHSDGAIWFTDPGYGILFNYEGRQEPFELPRHVYRIDPYSGTAAVVATDFDRPNGICFSPDEHLLYVVDTGATHTPGGPTHIRVFDVIDGRRLANGRVFAEMAPGFADGIRTDREGNLWVAAGWGGAGFDGVHCFAPDGTLIGKILLPEPCANLCFGGSKKNRLFMAASQSIYALYLETTGNQSP